MKKILICFSFILIGCFANAQNKSFDKRLLNKFSEAALIEMSSKSPDTYSYWNFYVANAYQVMDLPSEKSSAHEIKGEVKIENLNEVNIFDLKMAPLPKDYQYYRIEGKNKLLVIISEEQLKEKYIKSSAKK